MREDATAAGRFRQSADCIDFTTHVPRSVSRAQTTAALRPDSGRSAAVGRPEIEQPRDRRRVEEKTGRM
jgi:hypothetical protein